MFCPQFWRLARWRSGYQEGQVQALFQVTDFLYPNMTEKTRALSGAPPLLYFYIRHWFPPWGLYSHDLSTSQKPHLVISLPLGVRFQHVNFEGTQAFRPWHLLLDYQIYTGRIKWNNYFGQLYSNKWYLSYTILWVSNPFLHLNFRAAPTQVYKDVFTRMTAFVIAKMTNVWKEKMCKSISNGN